MRHKLLILLAAQQRAQVIVQPAATIMTLIHHSRHTVAVLIAQQFTINGAEARTIHRFHMHISQLTTRETIGHLALTVHPTLVQQIT